jgi:hypothetical protein
VPKPPDDRGLSELRGRRRNEPAGIERATRRADAPPRRTGKKPVGARLEEPPLAEDAPVDVPKGMRREVDKAITDAQHRDRVLQHVTAALAALDERDGATALPHLRWAKERATRSGLVREALGVASYLAEDYDEALSELAAYRRMTGRQDQNHIVADALRAVGRGQERIPELVLELEDDEEVPQAARHEARIVWASWLADSGDIGAGRAVLRHVLGDVERGDVEEHHLRTWYVAGDLAERGGATDEAVRHFERVAGAASGFFDTDERLARLR